MRLLLMLSLLLCAQIGLAESTTFEVRGYTCEAETGKILPNTSFEALPGLYYVVPEGKNSRASSRSARLDTSVSIDITASDDNAHFVMKFTCALPAKDALPTDAEGNPRELYAAVLCLGKGLSSIFNVRVEPGARWAWNIHLRNYEVTGRAVDDDGNPLGDAEITPTQTAPALLLTKLKTRTDADGKFSFQVPRWASYRLSGAYDLIAGDLVASSAFPSRAPYQAYFTADFFGKTVDLGDVRFSPHGRLRFQFDGNDAYTNLRALLQGPEGAESLRWYYCSPGQAFDRPIAQGDYILKFMFTAGGKYFTTEVPIKVKLGETSDLGTIEVRGARRLLVNLLSSGGLDLAQARLSARIGEASGSYRGVRNETGQFVFYLPAGKQEPVTFSASCEAHKCLEAKVELKPGQGELELTIVACAYLNASLVDPDGRTLWATIFAMQHGSESHNQWLAGNLDSWLDEISYRDRAKHGISEINRRAIEVSAGDYTVIARESDTGWLSVEVTTKIGETVACILQQKLLKVNLTITLDGKPLANSRVTIYKAGSQGGWWRDGELETDDDGVVELTIRKPKKLSLLVGDEGPRRAMEQELDARAFEIKEDTADVSVDVTPRFETSCTIKIIAGDDIPVTRIYYSPLSEWVGHKVYYKTDRILEHGPEGCKLQLLTPGHYRVTGYCNAESLLKCPDYLVDFEIKEGASQQLEFKPKLRVRKGKIKGLPEGARPLLTCWHSEYNRRERLHTLAELETPISVAADGSYEFRAPPLGDYSLVANIDDLRGGRAFPAGQSFANSDIQMSSDFGTLIVKVNIERGFDETCEFRLRSKDGSLICIHPDDMLFRADISSACVLNDLPVGRYDLIIHGEISVIGTMRDVEVGKGKTRIVNFSPEQAKVGYFRVPKPVDSFNYMLLTVEMLDAGGKTLRSWKSTDQGRFAPLNLLGCRYSRGFLGVEIRMKEVVSVRITQPGYKPMIITRKQVEDAPDDPSAELPVLKLEK